MLEAAVLMLSQWTHANIVIISHVDAESRLVVHRAILEEMTVCWAWTGMALLI